MRTRLERTLAALGFCTMGPGSTMRIRLNLWKWRIMTLSTSWLSRWADLGGSDATDFPRLGNPCPSLTLVHVHLCASLIFPFRCHRWCSLCLFRRYYQVFYNVSILSLRHHLACGDHISFAQHGIT